MQTAGRFISAFAISAYLAATFIPCESLLAVSGVTASASGIHAMHSEQESQPSQTAASHDHVHAHSHSASYEEIQASGKSARLEFRPTCQCGCSDTRSQVGGGAARLGSVVPGTVFAGLFDAEHPAPGIRVPPRAFDLDFEIDPIPI